MPGRWLDFSSRPPATIIIRNHQALFKDQLLCYKKNYTKPLSQLPGCHNHALVQHGCSGRPRPLAQPLICLPKPVSSPKRLSRCASASVLQKLAQPFPGPRVPGPCPARQSPSPAASATRSRSCAPQRLQNQGQSALAPARAQARQTRWRAPPVARACRASCLRASAGLLLC